MSDRPAHALRNKTHSSMAKAIKLVAEGQAQACVSSGNTGALMGFGLKYLGALPAIDRPAICKAMPTMRGYCYLLDLGANVSASAQQLLEFGIMGAAMAQTAGNLNPSVGLLNMGREIEKGDNLRRDALELMQRQQSTLNFIGFVEGDDIYEGSTDVIVCDGFTGNAVLKASEGAFQLLSSRLSNVFNVDRKARVVKKLAESYLQSWRSAHHPSSHNGAAFLGLNGIVVKSHGAASPDAFESALRVAHDQALSALPSMIAAAMTKSSKGEKTCE